MALPEKHIIDGIYAAMKTIHSSEPETLTVRNVRNKAEADLGLETGLLSNESWKDKSKKLIKDYASELADATDEPEVTASKPKVAKKAASVPKKAAPVKKSTKRAAPEPKARVTKRQKKADTPSVDETSELTELTPTEGSEVSDFGDSEDNHAPKKKEKGAMAKGKAPAKRQSKSKAKLESESEEMDGSIQDEVSGESIIEDSDNSDAPRKKTKAKPKTRTPVKRQSKSKAKIADSDASEEEADSEASAPKKKPEPKKSTSKTSAKAIVDSDAESEDDKPAPKGMSTPKRDTPKSSTTGGPDSDAEDKPASKPDVGSDSEMSIVLDPTPKPKRQRAPKGEKTAKEPKAPKAKAASKAKAVADLSPDEAQIKALQSQLLKCGMKKIWQFELKQYGDDSKAKIRHLQDVLKEIGMTGRFSDARAREIKEMRELQADLEAVKEGEKAWGLESGRRRGAAVTKSMKEVSDSEEEESGEEAGPKKMEGRQLKSASKLESGSEAPPRKQRINPELAFLSSEEDSDE